MNNQELWEKRVDVLWNAEILFEDLKEKKLLKKEQKNKINKKLEELSCWVWLNSPKTKSLPIAWKRDVFFKCLSQLNSLYSFYK